MPEWSEYKVKGNIGDTSYKELTSVSHVAHLDNAFGILQNKSIQRRFIYDESKLTKKIEVVWLSSNDWAVNGFRYGTTRFTFDFQKLVRGKKFYWVEAIKKYRPTACRILVTSKIYEDLSLEEYDITSKEGPIWLDEEQGTYYWNGIFTLELMIDEDISIDSEVNIDFVVHHNEFCCLGNVDKCREKSILSIVRADLA